MQIINGEKKITKLRAFIFSLTVAILLDDVVRLLQRYGLKCVTLAGNYILVTESLLFFTPRFPFCASFVDHFAADGFGSTCIVYF